MMLLAGCAGGSTTRGTEELTRGYIDAHVHIWTDDTQRYPLGPGRSKPTSPPTFTAEELLQLARPAGVTRVVLIHIGCYGVDNSYMLDMMRQYEGVFSGVAMIDQQDEPRAKMVELASQGVRGFRISPPSENEADWLNSESMATMWKCGADEGLAMCLLTNPEQLPLIDKMCQKYPGTPVVIDHLARIGLKEIRQKDVDNLCHLARHKQVTVKASAFYALGEKKAPYLDLAPLLRRVLDCFGPERVMWATDCPFQALKGHTYEDSVTLISERLDFLTESDREWILRKSAERVFFS
jgi:predicted TIM-barrel fold metal-dependent hydrolase